MWKAGRSCPTGHSCEFCVSATTKEGCLRVYYQRDRSDFDHDLPFAPPALRRRQLYTLTFRPGARLARQTIGGRLRTITGTCHPKRVNCASASASGQEGCRTKVIGRRLSDEGQELAPIGCLFVFSRSGSLRIPSPFTSSQSSKAPLLTPSSHRNAQATLLIRNLTNTHAWSRSMPTEHSR